nr:YkgJ family cysteine cluster protein [uncultured Fluviicola sp.]
MNLKELIDYGKAEKEFYNKWIKKAKKANNRNLDEQFHQLHEEAFRKIDCLACANCCKTTSPIFRDVDIKRLSKRLKMPESKLIDTYLIMDEDQDYVLKSAPCPFLGSDNYCSVYEDRPLACREYPHTNRKNMYQILPLTRKNMEVCPAVSYIMQEISKKI